MGSDMSPDQKRSGCGLLNAVFGRRRMWPRRSTSTGSLQTNQNQPIGNVTRVPSTPIPKRSQDYNSSTFDDQRDKIVYSKSPPPAVYNHHRQDQQPQPTTHANTAENISSNNVAVTNAVRNPQSHGQYSMRSKAPQPGLGISGELESMIQDHQRSKGAGNLVRASSSNVMLVSDLGNLRQAGNNANSNNAVDYVPKRSNFEDNKRNNGVPQKPDSLCRALSTRMDPEQLKILGNEDYKNGKFAEALALYDAAISIDPNKASYRSNKSAALTALGKLLEAASECREAIRIDPFYHRAHNRLATLYVRLGEAEKAMYHFKQSGSESDPDAMNRAKRVQIHLSKCTEAKRQRDWNTLLKETELAITSGADSAPLIFALKAEALLKLNRHQEAIDTLSNGPKYDIDECTKIFGPIGSSSLLLVRAQVDMVSGRFDEAVASAQCASRLDPNNREANAVMRRTKAVAASRSKGNDLFKAGKYLEACDAYGEGLNHDPYNSILLCNRAACRSNLGQLDKAVEDCNAAVNVRPGYRKARLRRADCYAKMGKWRESVQDCEVLMEENEDDEQVGQIYKEAKGRLEK